MEKYQRISLLVPPSFPLLPTPRFCCQFDLVPTSDMASALEKYNSAVHKRQSFKDDTEDFAKTLRVSGLCSDPPPHLPDTSCRIRERSIGAYLGVHISSGSQLCPLAGMAY